MNKTRTRLLASLLCMALIFADVIPTGLVAQAAEVSQQTFAEAELGTDGEEITPEVTLGEEEQNPELPDINLLEENQFAVALAADGEIIAEGSYTEDGSDTAWVIDGNGKLTVTGTGEVTSESGSNRMPWSEYREQIITAEISVKDMKDASCLFDGCDNLESIDLTGFDTSNVTNMSMMFNGCSNVAELDVSGFETGNVTDMSNMFFNCASLEGLDTSKWDTRAVTNMSSMFTHCEKLTKLDLSSFDTQNVTNMGSMFLNCFELTELKLAADTWNTGKVRDMSNMFDGCSNLTKLDVSSWNTGNVTNMFEMFYECSKLKELDLSGWDMGRVVEGPPLETINAYLMFFGCTNLETIYAPLNLTMDIELPLSSDTDVWYRNDTGETLTKLPLQLTQSVLLTRNNLAEEGREIITRGTYTQDGSNTKWVLYENGKLVVTGTGEVTSESGYNRMPWSEYREQIYTAEISVTGMTDASYLFYECTNLESINVSGFDTSNVEDMFGMFAYCSSLTELDVSGFETSNVTNMGMMFHDCSNLTELNVSDFKTRNVENMFDMFFGCGNLAELDVSGFETENVTNMGSMFDGCSKVESINVSGFNTSSVTSMRQMFYRCSGLTELDVRDFDTSKVTDMHAMFDGCSNLAELDVSGFKTSNVMDMSDMFYNCSSLTELNVSHFETDNVEDMYCMFMGCSNLTELDVSGFETENVINMGFMFWKCTSLTELGVSGFETKNVENMERMFAYCSSLTSLDLSRWDTGRVGDIDDVGSIPDMFLDCDSLETIYAPLNLNLDVELPLSSDEDVWYRNDTGETLTKLPLQLTQSVLLTRNKLAEEDEEIIDRGGSDVKWVLYKDGRLVVTGEGEVKSFGVPWSNYRDQIKTAEIRVSGATDVSELFSRCSNLESIDVSGFDTSNVTTMARMFYECSSLKEVVVSKEGTSKWNTGKVESMSMMFYNCSSLTDLDVSSWGTSNVTSMEMMFYGCNSLAYLNVSNWNTSNVNDLGMEYMFSGCSSLTELDVSKWDTSRIGNMYSMFRDCSSLTKLDVSNWNTDSVEQMGVMFDGCSSLTELDVSGWNTGNVRDMSNMFYGCGNLTKLDVSSWDTGNVKNMQAMFINCSSLTELNVSDWDTGNVENMNSMFSGCSSLTKLDVSGFETGKVTGMSGMFSGCSSLTELNVSGFKTENVTSMYVMFFECSSLTELNLNGFDTRNVTDVGAMFYGCSSLRELDLSGCDFGNVTKTTNIFNNCNNLKVIYAPLNVDELIDITLPGGPWYRADTGEAVTLLPKGLSNSIQLIKDKKDEEDIRTEYSVTFNMMGHGTAITAVDVAAGSLLEVPGTLQEGDIVTEGSDSYVFVGWYKDKTFAEKQKWNFETDTVQADITLYACWLKTKAEMNLYVKDIEIQTYTGSAIKPTVYVYDSVGGTLLKSGKDYTVTYKNNVAASIDDEGNLLQEGIKYTRVSGKTEELIVKNGFSEEQPYVLIKGKGNYAGNVYMNFSIQPASISAEDENMTLASGFALKYTEQLVTNKNKDQKPFTSLKYKKAMKAGTDYDVKLTAVDALDAGNATVNEGTVIGESGGITTLPAIPKGYSGIFLMTVTGKGNYRGTVTKKIYVADENHIMSKASITLGKNLKSVKYSDWINKDVKEVRLTPANYRDGKYYIVDEKTGEEIKESETNGNDVFTVKFGKNYLAYQDAGKDESNYLISYEKNDAVGTATMTITGNPERGYFGSKSVTFKITGTAFNTKNVIVVEKDTAKEGEVDFQTAISYTGKAITQNNVTLKSNPTSGDGNSQILVYGKDYTISYKNNLKKGTATMTFTANPESGYSGSFKKTFKITPQSLLDVTFGEKDIVSNEQTDSDKNTKTMIWSGVTPSYSKNGATLSFTLKNAEGMGLKQGTDYTVSYKNNKAVTEGNTSIPANKQPTLTIKGKGNYAGTLTVTFQIQQANIAAVLDDNSSLTISAASVEWKENKQFKDFKFKVLDGKKALSEGEGKDYKLDTETNRTDETIKDYVAALEQKKENGTEITAKEPTVIIEGVNNYTGKAEVSLADYIYITKLTSKNLKVEIIGDTTYIGADSDSGLKPTVKVTYYPDNNAGKTDAVADPTFTEKDYIVTYGANNTAGKNKGSVTVTGTGIYGGSVTVKFTIDSKTVYK